MEPFLFASEEREVPWIWEIYGAVEKHLSGKKERSASLKWLTNYAMLSKWLVW